VSDQTFTVPELGLSLTVSPRTDGLVFVYLDTGDTPPDLHDRLRVRINDASLIAEDDALPWVQPYLRPLFTDRFTDPIPEEEP
jgi:hypothetical protein